VPVAASTTPHEVAASATERLGDGVGAPARHLARLHDVAAYAPRAATPEPGRRRGDGSPAGDEAWLLADTVRRELRGARRPAQRLRAALSPEALLRLRSARTRSTRSSDGAARRDRPASLGTPGRRR